MAPMFQKNNTRRSHGPMCKLTRPFRQNDSRSQRKSKPCFGFVFRCRSLVDLFSGYANWDIISGWVAFGRMFKVCRFVLFWGVCHFGAFVGICRWFSSTPQYWGTLVFHERALDVVVISAFVFWHFMLYRTAPHEPVRCGNC